MRLFNFRKSNKSTVQSDSQVPDEVRSFTRAEQRERASLAWVVGIISLLVLIAIFICLFFAGRWAYSQLTDNGTSPDTTENPDSKDKDEKSAEENKAKKEKQDAAARENNSAQSAQGTTQQTTPVTGPSEDETLPQTGPDLDL